MLEKIFTPNRLKLLRLFISHSANRYYQRQLEKLLGINIRSLQIELGNLLEAGFLKKEKDGNRMYYTLNEKFPLLAELQPLILKGTFMLNKLRNILTNNKMARLVFIYGSAAKGDLLERSDIDLFIVGKVDSAKLHAAIKNLESDFSRTINYIVYDASELQRKAKEKAGFIMDVLNNNKIYIKGDDDELRRLIK